MKLLFVRSLTPVLYWYAESAQTHSLTLEAFHAHLEFRSLSRLSHHAGFLVGQHHSQWYASLVWKWSKILRWVNLWWVTESDDIPAHHRILIYDQTKYYQRMLAAWKVGTRLPSTIRTISQAWTGCLFYPGFCHFFCSSEVHHNAECWKRSEHKALTTRLWQKNSAKACSWP